MKISPKSFSGGLLYYTREEKKKGRDDAGRTSEPMRHPHIDFRSTRPEHLTVFHQWQDIPELWPPLSNISLSTKMSVWSASLPITLHLVVKDFNPSSALFRKLLTHVCISFAFLVTLSGTLRKRWHSLSNFGTRTSNLAAGALSLLIRTFKRIALIWSSWEKYSSHDRVQHHSLRYSNGVEDVAMQG